MLHRKSRCAFRDIVGEVDEELSKASLGGCIVTENGGKGGIAERFGKALTQGFSGSAIVAQAAKISLVRNKNRDIQLTEGNSAQHA